MLLDAETEWRVKWAQRGIVTFCSSVSCVI